MNIPRMSIMLCTIQASSPQRKQKQLQKAYERIEEIDAEVWTDDDLSDDEIEARYAKYDDEITSLNAQIETLEKKAGWYEGCYGNLSEDEVNQLNSIYNKIDAIYDNIYNGSDNLSDEEFASRYAKYSDEIDALEAQAIALEAKAGGTKNTDILILKDIIWGISRNF